MIDTAVVFGHKREDGGVAFKSALRWLAKQLLGSTIQATDGGHDRSLAQPLLTPQLRRRARLFRFGSPSTS